MSAAPRRCSSCGTAIPRPEARFCELCGAALVAEPEPEPPDPFGDVGARFGALARHDELPRLLGTKPEIPELAGKTLPSLLLLVLLAVMGFFAAIVSFQLCPPVGFALLALIVVGFLMLSKEMLLSARTPLVARPALVVELRTRLQAGAEHSPDNTRHHAMLQFDDGQRSEHECFPSALDGLEAGALGVAYLKGERLAAFARVGL